MADINKEKSCGAIIFAGDFDQIKVLLIKNENGGHWSFPKGHVDPGETEEQTAIREVSEETGLQIKINTPFKTQVSYLSSPDTQKEVIYFAAVSDVCETKNQPGEIADSCWCDAQYATSLITFENEKEAFSQAFDYIKNAKLIDLQKSVRSAADFC